MGKPNVNDVRLSKRLSTNLVTYRKASQHTQKSLADLIGVDKETISRFERGVALPSLLTLEKLGDHLAIPLNDLLGQDAVPLNNTAVILTSLLNELDEDDQEYVHDSIKALCRHLQKRKAPVEKRKQETRPWSTRSAAPQGSKE